IEDPQGTHRSGERIHGMARLREGLHQVDDLVLEAAVVDQVVGEGVELLLGGKFAEEKKVARLLVGALLRQLLDRVPAIEQDPPLTVDVTDLRFGGRDPGQSGNVGDRVAASVHWASSSLRCRNVQAVLALAECAFGFYHLPRSGETFLFVPHELAPRALLASIPGRPGVAPIGRPGGAAAQGARNRSGEEVGSGVMTGRVRL